jgi:hypothetical protein
MAGNAFVSTQGQTSTRDMTPLKSYTTASRAQAIQIAFGGSAVPTTVASSSAKNLGIFRNILNLNEKIIGGLSRSPNTRTISPYKSTTSASIYASREGLKQPLPE